MPVSPSMATIAQSLTSDGFWKPSSMMITSAPAATAMAAPATRSAATTVGASAASNNASSPTWSARSSSFVTMPFMV